MYHVSACVDCEGRSRELQMRAAIGGATRSGISPCWYFRENAHENTRRRVARPSALTVLRDIDRVLHPLGGPKPPDVEPSISPGLNVHPFGRAERLLVFSRPENRSVTRRTEVTRGGDRHIF